MSLPSTNATLPSPGLPAHSGDLLAHELASLVQDIQRTREWFNNQLDAQLASLRQLCAATPAKEPARHTVSTSTLYQAPRAVMVAPVAAPLHAADDAPPAVLPPQAAARPAPPAHPAIILPPTLTATLDPELEQATLHELNNALTRAFAEISARGGMLDPGAC